MRVKLLIVSLLFVLNSWLSAQEALNGYLQTAADNNPTVKMHFNNYMASLEVVSQVNTLPDPQLAFAYFIQPVETRVGPQQFKLSASQLFPWFGTLKAKENGALQTAKANFERFEESKSKLTSMVKSTYYNLYVNDKAINIMREQLAILSTYRKLAEMKVEAGMASALDVYRIEMEVNDMENQLAVLLDKKQALQVSFYNLINSKETKSVSLPDTFKNHFTLSKADALDSILRFNHQLLGIQLAQKALRYNTETAKLMGKPTIKLGLDYTIIGKGADNRAGTDAIVFPSVGISIPLYRNKYKAMIQEARYKEEANSNKMDEKTNFLVTLFEESWNDYKDSKRRIPLFEKQLSLAKRSLAIIETDYATGNQNFEEVLRIERKVLAYHLELEKARADEQAAMAFIYYLMGD